MNNDLAAAIESALDSSLKEKIKEKIEELTAEAAERIKAECAPIVDSAVEEARQAGSRDGGAATASELAESVRRIRREDSINGIASALVECAARFCGRSALFIHKGDKLLGFRTAGVDRSTQAAFEKLAVPIAKAASIARAVESLAPVTAAGRAEDLSSPVVEAFGLSEDDSVRLYPVALRDKVLAVLYADASADGAEIVSPALEVLVSLTEAWIEAVGARKKSGAA